MLQEDTRLEVSGLQQYLETLAGRDQDRDQDRDADGKARYLSNVDLFGSSSPCPATFPGQDEKV
ncbi:MAG: hypothetical protein L0I76_03140 [Pseudonocardia sp.]|nr:hypothetical protein [Pseudonocardia sp.]